MEKVPDTTPSAENRELYPARSHGSEYGGRWSLPASRAVSGAVEVNPAADGTDEVEQLDLFSQPIAEPQGSTMSEEPGSTPDQSTLDRFLELQRKRYGSGSDYANSHATE